MAWVIARESAGFDISIQRRGVTPLVLLLKRSGNNSARSLTVTVRSSLDGRRPYVMKGEVWEATGIVSQFARKAPWNGGYRVLVRFQSDLVKIGWP